MSRSPCYPEPYDWGGPSAPAAPRGWYKPLYQAMDGGGYPRIFPATLAQCAGFITKGDKWCSQDFDTVLTYVNHGVQWAPYINIPGLWIPFTALYLNLHAVGFISPGFYWDVLWALFYNPSASEPWYLTQSRIQAPNTTRNVLTGATYAYNAAPWSNLVIPQRAIAISNGSVFGNVWDNPI